MNIHDWILSLGLVLTAVMSALQIFDRAKAPLKTTIPLAIILAVFACNFATMRLPLSTALEALNAVVMAIVAFQVAWPRYCPCKAHSAHRLWPFMTMNEIRKLGRISK